MGGARPKANIIDLDGHLCIAKFPSKSDTIDKAAWEYLAYELARKAGINMSFSALEKVKGPYHTFLSRRFDREAGHRIHFASAMTMTGNNEEIIRDATPSYLEIAEFIQTYGSNIVVDLHQLWRRIVFHMAISNTDDHFRNHGFLLEEKGWRLWNQLRILAQDGKITTWLNGKQMVEIEDEKIGAANGFIALQIHDGGGIKVRWKDIKIKQI